MSAYDSGNPGERSLSRDLWSAARYYLGSRIGIIAMAAVALGAGAWFNWGWLVAAGIAPLLLAALPCAAMCALGLCMKGGSKNHVGEVAPFPGASEESPLRLAAVPGEKQDATPVSGQPAQAKPRNRKDCC